MTDLFRAFLAWSKTPQGTKMVRYVLGSVITTAVSFTSIAILFGFRIIPGVMWSTLTGNLIATIPAYWLNRTWTWGKRGRSHFFKEMVPFWSMSLLSIAFSQVGAFWARFEVHHHVWSRLADTGLVTGTNLVCFGVFFVLKILVFNRIFHVGEASVLAEPLAVGERAA